MWWAWNEGIEGRDYRKSRQKEADVGTVAHTLIECEIKGIPFDWDNPDVADIAIAEREEFYARATKSLANFKNWKGQSGFKPICTELALVSEQYLYGGCLDCVAVIDGEVALFDWKSSKKSGYAEYELQTAAYVNLWNEAVHNGTLPDAVKEALKQNIVTGKSWWMDGGIYILRIDKDEPDNWDIKKRGVTGWRMKLAFNTFLHLIPVHYAKYVLEKKKPIDEIEEWMWWPELKEAN